MTVVLAEDKAAYQDWCAKHNLDHANHKVVVALVTYSDVYRLYGRDLVGARVVQITPVKPKLLTHFKKALRSNGWRKLPQ